MNKKFTIMLMVFGLIVLSLAACGNSNNAANENAVNGNAENENITNENTEDKGTLEMSMPPWVNSPPQAYMVKMIIEDHLGWEVDITEADIGLSYASTANGTTDFFVDAWVPSHDPYIEEHEGDLEILSQITTLEAPGLVVPDYVDIDSIEELNDHVDEFNGEIIGIEPGAGIMEQTTDAIEEYDLDYDMVEGSDFAMATVLGDAIDFDEWIVVTGWTPHWKFIKYDLKFLDDPEKIYGESNIIHPVINKDMHDKAPEVVNFLENWEVDISVWDEMIYATAVDEEDIEPVVREWLDDNEDLVEEWLE